MSKPVSRGVLHVRSTVYIEKELCHTALLKYFADSTHFNLEETDKLIETFKNLGSKSGGSVKRNELTQFLCSVFGISDEFMLMRVYDYFDDDHNGKVQLREWMRAINILLKGTLDERIEYAYNIYDFTNSGILNKDELFFLLKDAVIKRPADEDPKDSVKELVEIALKLLDTDKDGRISFSDFKKAVQKQPLLLEAFGKCLPDSLEIKSFLTTCMIENDKSQMGNVGMFSPTDTQQKEKLISNETEMVSRSQAQFNSLDLVGDNINPSLLVDIGIDERQKGFSSKSQKSVLDLDVTSAIVSKYSNIQEM